MALVSDSIPNLVGGVSQQPSKLRLPSQCEDQVSCDSSIVEGLGKRPPTTHVRRLIPYGPSFTSADAKDAAAHTITRDLTERYQVIAYGSTLRVFDLLDGTEKTVNTPDGTNYLLCSSSKKAMTFTTIQDHTFVVNKEKTIEMLSAPADSRGIEAIVFVQVANYQTDYYVTLDGFLAKVTTTRFGYDQINTGHGPVGGAFTSDPNSLPAGTEGAPATLSTEAIAATLKSHLADHHPNASNYEFVVSRSLLWARRDNGADFTLSYTDSRGNTQMSIAKEKVQRLTDLPAVAPHGFQVEITGDPSTRDDNYFAQFEQTSPSLVIGEGLWKEIAKPGIPVELNAATMPHLLVRESNGTFTFKRGAWGKRVAGDLDTAPDPSFVGSTVNDAFLLRNRLGFLSGENAILSRAAKHFEFFVASATALTDSDPIDESASHIKASLLRHAVPFRKRLFLFSDETQFELQYGGTTLSSETAEIVPVWEFKSSQQFDDLVIRPTAKPVGAGKSLYFPMVRDQRFSGIQEVVVEEGTTALTNAAEITAHVPSYVPAGIRKLAASPNEGILLGLSDVAPRSLFVHRGHWARDEKVLTSWSRWDYYDDDPNSGIINIDFVDDACAVLAYHSDGVYLERFSVAPMPADPGWAYQFKLDRRVDEAMCSTFFDGDKTTITAPFPLPEKTRIVARFPDDHTKKPGSVAIRQSLLGSQITVLGDWTSAKVYLGETYASRYVFSPQFVRKPSQGGGQEIIGTGRLQMLFWTLHFADTGYFEVHVTPHKGGLTYVQQVSGMVLGTPEAVIGGVPIVSGQVRVGIMAKNTEALVEVISESHLPFHLTSVDWEGNYVAQSRRL